MPHFGAFLINISSLKNFWSCYQKRSTGIKKKFHDLKKNSNLSEKNNNLKLIKKKIGVPEIDNLYFLIHFKHF